ncbi:MAG: ATP-dependent DNA helicase RecG [Candidatus Saccharimonadia bacterium]
MIELDQPIATVKGVGESQAKKLFRLKIYTVGDLLAHYPRKYNDFTNVSTISKLRPGLVTVQGKIVTSATRRARSKRLTITEAILSDDTGTIKAIWFNQSYLLKSLPKGETVVLSGKLEFRNNDLALQSPLIEKADSLEAGASIVPVYRETDGLSSKQIHNIVKTVIANLAPLPENLPNEAIVKYKLLARLVALTEVHLPSSTTILEQAKKRIAFEELFGIILASLSLKQEIKTEKSISIPFDQSVAKLFLEHLDFELTDAQRKVAWQILLDLERDHPMNRLVEGDVGSGKTVVALFAAVMTMSAGFQVVIMVPTEILAIQHFEKISKLLTKLSFKVELIVGNAPAKLKKLAIEATSSGEANLVIGTHALLSRDVKFANLGLVVIDEQHRFGVEQRQILKQKAGILPHLLSMTATPIPRSLALTVYGDLDISIIDELPPGRMPITTKLIKNSERDAMYSIVDQEIEAGRQVFLVCPLIEESENLEAKSVLEESDRLKQSIFSHRTIDVIHGKLSSKDKTEVMQRYRNKEIDILIATSVIEVGIDIPNATIMIIEGADHFGLAALHQLRGRIGRGSQSSVCYLLYDSFSPNVAQRLRALERTNDGFRLAQIDLELRGPGQIYGHAQHGILDLQMADVSDTKLVAEVRDSANAFLRDESAMLNYPYIWENVNALKSVTSLD